MKNGLDVELIDHALAEPVADWETIATSVSRKTSRVLVAYEDMRSWGYGAEIAARIADELFDDLDAPVRRIAAKGHVRRVSAAAGRRNSAAAGRHSQGDGGTGKLLRMARRLIIDSNVELKPDKAPPNSISGVVENRRLFRGSTSPS